ncbi:thiolase-like protein [Thozetella sp. PMI_491]|nr:thiolase-like protein [Thozetella sp. PMI_491]
MDSSDKITAERKIAHLLLVELLAHQLAYPVKWIDTQDVLFSDRDIRRMVELGPSNVLSNMAKRTRDLKFQTMDSVLGLKRDFLSVSRDAQSIQYKHGTLDTLDNSTEHQLPLRSPPASTKEDLATKGNSAPLSLDNPPETRPVVAAQEVSTPADAVPDAPLTPLEIISSLVSIKLKRPLSQIAPSKSLSELSSGRSTLQNELVGDIASEFGSVSDGAEQLSLAALAAGLQPVKNGTEFGKTVSQLVARWISATMPAGFGVATMRDYFRVQWGLGPGRQHSVLLAALVRSTIQPPPPLSTVSEAKAFLQGIVTDYAKECGISLGSASAATSSRQTVVASIDPSVLATLSEEPRRLAAVQQKALAAYLGLEDASALQIRELESAQEQWQAQRDLWLSEFGPAFEEGIKPLFDVRKLRHFDFSWNQARLELLDLFGALNSRSNPFSGIPLSALQKLADKCGTESLALIRRLEAKADEVGGQTSARSRFAREMADMTKRSLQSGPQYVLLKSASVDALGESSMGPFVSLRAKVDGSWVREDALTTQLLDNISTLITSGASFRDKVVLITGAGPNSIGAEIVKGLLMGGAVVVVTTSRDIAVAQAFFQPIYTQWGSRGSQLFVLPFNQASVADCRQLVDYILGAKGLGSHIDVLIPMAAVPEKHAEIDQLGEHSELAHRLMLTNVLRLAGLVIEKKTELGIECRPTQLLLPLSPNHGIFGGDGLYSESKLGLESLLNRVSSESWRDKLSVCGVVIGWTRGTGLMGSNDVVAEAIESHGVLTFTAREMALNMLALLLPPVSSFWELQPILADYAGGMQRLPDLKAITREAREAIQRKSEVARLIAEEDRLERSMVHDGKEGQAPGSYGTAPPGSPLLQPANSRRSRFQLEFPPLHNHQQDLLPLHHLRDMVDLSSTVVVVGYSELGPWGSSRTRWQMESHQILNASGYVEMAWIMGLIEHADGAGGGNAKQYVGWFDAANKKPLDEDQIRVKFGQQILENAGVRVIDPESSGGYDPMKKEYLQEVAIEADLPEFETDRATAEAIKLKHGNNCIVQELDGSCRVVIKAGARIMIPKVSPLSSSHVAGLLPKGWDPARYGIPQNIVDQVDRTTLYTLICVAEAFLSAGIEDPATELFRYFHPAELGNFVGTSIGSTSKTRDMHRNVFLDKSVQVDFIQEVMMNSAAAWVNMLLLGASGPIKTPVGACATSMESLDNAVESIRLGHTRMCVVGGVDAFHEDESYGFASMKATADTGAQAVAGRLPKEMSRPTAESRAGFIESEGCGVQILCAADLALEMGLPVYAIVAGSAMAADKIGRSLPAPGKGVLTFAREAEGAAQSPVLDVDYRRSQMRSIMAAVASGMDRDGDFATSPLSLISSPSSNTTSGWQSVSSSGGTSTPDLVPGGIAPSTASAGSTGSSVVKIEEADARSHSPMLHSAFEASIRAIRRQWSTDLRRLDPRISPLRASLAVWGLTVDDIGVVSMHGTSTKANDMNEPATLQAQMEHLGRAGRPLLAVAQKSVTGHPKAPAAAWMLNGCLQMLATGVVPGNFAVDNVEPALAKMDHLVFPTTSLNVGGPNGLWGGEGLRAFMLSSFGFGQKGAQMVGVAPRYLFATLGEKEYRAYSDRCSLRKKRANRSFANAILRTKLVKMVDSPLYAAGDESRVLLSPSSRVRLNKDGREEFKIDEDDAAAKDLI